MKNKVSILSTIITVTCVTIAVNAFTYKNTLSDEDIKREIERINKDELPIELNESMRLDSIIISLPKVLCYYVTADVFKEEVEYDAMEEYLHPILLEDIKTNKELIKYRNSNVTWKYRFNDKNGAFFHEYTITPQGYKSNSLKF